MPSDFITTVRRISVALLRLAAAWIISFQALADTPAPAKTPRVIPPDAPIIVADEPFFDFGKISHDKTVTHGFTLSNTGKSTLHIKEVHANCGCTSTVIGKMILEPGESTVIEAEFTPEKNFSGAVRKTILVVSDAPAHSKLILRFAAEVLPSSSPEKPPRDSAGGTDPGK